MAQANMRGIDGDREGIRGQDHNCPVGWLLRADKSIIEYGF